MILCKVRSHGVRRDMEVGADFLRGCWAVDEHVGLQKRGNGGVPGRRRASLRRFLTDPVSLGRRQRRGRCRQNAVKPRATPPCNSHGAADREGGAQARAPPEMSNGAMDDLSTPRRPVSSAAASTQGSNGAMDESHVRARACAHGSSPREEPYAKPRPNGYGHHTHTLAFSINLSRRNDPVLTGVPRGEAIGNWRARHRFRSRCHTHTQAKMEEEGTCRHTHWERLGAKAVQLGNIRNRGAAFRVLWDQGRGDGQHSSQRGSNLWLNFERPPLAPTSCRECRSLPVRQ